MSSWWNVWEACSSLVGAQDYSGLYCGDYLTVSIISCLCVILGRRALNGGLSSVAFKCHRITQDHPRILHFHKTQDNPGCLTNSVFKPDIYTKMSDLKD